MEAKPQIIFSLILLLFSVVHSDTFPNDLDVLNQFRKGLENGELLHWPVDGNDPCGTHWSHIYCSGNRVTQIQVRGLGLNGPLPGNFNRLSMLQNLGLQQNNFSGKLPSFSGLSELKYAYLDKNNFDSIPADFFSGLGNLEVLALDNNPINETTGWSLPSGLSDAAQLRNLTLMSCNLAGPLPEFLGKMSSLSVLKLSANRLSGEIPASFSSSSLNVLWLNEQTGGGMTGSIDVVSSMVGLTSLHLDGNHFSGKIPDNIGELVSLKDLNLNGNDFVGLVPVGLANMGLDKLDLSNNHLMGPIPDFKTVGALYDSNSFCSERGASCSPDVMALLDFLDGFNYPPRLVESWSGNDPCQGSWMGVGCDSKGKIITINLPKYNLSGTLSPSIVNLCSLSQIFLQSNNISGPIPTNWTGLTNLTILNLSDNDISPPLPKNFVHNLKLIVEGNPLITSNSSGNSDNHAPSSSPSMPSTVTDSYSTGSGNASIGGNRSNRSKLLAIVSPVALFVFLVCLVVPFMICICKKKRKDRSPTPLSSVVIHPRESSDSNNVVKIVVANDMNRTGSSLTPSGSTSIQGSGSHVIESGNLVISVQVLRNVTKDFDPENELGRGGFGVVYKGELDDGTKIAVKRMESGVINRKALDEFQSEIAVLSKVRHRHLVSLLGYSVEGNERILVYEYMPQGALSRHLFHWKKFQIEALSWKKRLNIALDVARGMEYLHTLAHQSFIHRDLKSSNILLGDDFRAKVSDFGLVKLAPDGEKSVVTRLAGTFGYFAPEYAVMGKITTKTDVFSFGVVLMELLTGMMALDEGRSEESQYLVSWFWQIKSSPKTLMAAIDPAIELDDDKLQSISIISELAGHCTAREPNQRPEMGHAVNVLGSLVEKWKPLDDEEEDYCGIDYSLPLKEMVKDWQDAEGTDVSFMDLDDSKGSIPSRPTGFADSFTSSDGR